MTPVDWSVLENAERFRFVTRKQMRCLGVASDNKHLGDRLRKLKGGRLIGEIAPSFENGRLPALYYLRQAGARALGEYLGIDPDELHFRADNPTFNRDRKHLEATVDFHIALYLDTGDGLDFFIPYYSYSGANNSSGKRLRSTAKIELSGNRGLIPDGLFYANSGLGAVEIIRGRRSDKKRVLNQLERHRDAAKVGAIGTALDIKSNARLFCVFDDEGLASAICKVVSNDQEFRPLKKLWLWKMTTDVSAGSFFDGWQPMIAGS